MQRPPSARRARRHSAQRAAALVVACLALATGCSSAPDDAAAGSAARPASGGLALPADLCALNPPDKILAAAGLPGPGTVLPNTGALASDPNARFCTYLGQGVGVDITVVKGWDRTKLDAGRASAAGTDLPGLADGAYSVQNGPRTTVIALDRDLKISVAALNVPANQLASVVKLLVSELR